MHVLRGGNQQKESRGARTNMSDLAEVVDKFHAKVQYVPEWGISWAAAKKEAWEIATRTQMLVEFTFNSEPCTAYPTVIVTRNGVMK